MTDKLTAADVLRIVADGIWGQHCPPMSPRQDAADFIAENLRIEAARREAVCPTCKDTRCVATHTKDHEGNTVKVACPDCNAPPPPADDLCARLLAMQHMDPCYPTPHPLCAKAAAAIEALRAREKALDAVAEAAQALERAVTDEFNEKGASGFAFARLSDLRNALDGLAAGGGNG